MCGIIGIFNGEKSGLSQMKLSEFMLAGCITGVLRGMDSTGMYQVKKDKAVRLFKQPVDGGTFAQMRGTQRLIKDVPETSATVIHHRAATHGVVSLENAHPFEHEDENRYLVGVHNGGVANFNRKEDGLDFQVDSDWLYYRIFRDGPEKALSELTGNPAYALVWYDQDKDRHYIASNGQRTIAFAFIKNKNIMLVASEHAHLYWLASRYELELEETVWHPNDDVIYEFNTEDLRAYKTARIPKKSYPVHTGSTSRWNAQKGAWEPNPTVNSTYGSVLVSRTSTSTHSVVERFSADACKEAGVEMQASYEFTPTSLEERIRSVPQLVYGYISSPQDVLGEIYPAVMEVKSPVLLDNLRDAQCVYTRVKGVREETEKSTNKVKPFVLLETPHNMVFDNNKEDEEVLQEQKDEFEEPTTKGPGGRNITEAQFKHLTKDGCSNCSSDIHLSDQDYLYWVNGGSDVLCKDCGEDLESTLANPHKHLRVVK